MLKKLGLGLTLILVVLGLTLLPMTSVAAEEDGTTETTTEAEGSVRGPGAMIIMIGLGAILAVGGAYAARQPAEK